MAYLTDKEQKFLNDSFSKEDRKLMNQYLDGQYSGSQEKLDFLKKKFENLNKDILAQRRVKAKTVDIKAVDAFNVGLLDDKYKLAYLETKYPELKFREGEKEIEISRDGGNNFTEIKADPKLRISRAAGAISPFALGVGAGIAGGIAGAPGGPPGAVAGSLAAGGVTSGALQTVREAIESQIDPGILRNKGIEPQTLLQRSGDVKTAAITDMVAGKAVGALLDGGAVSGLKGIAKNFRKAGTVSDEFIQPRIAMQKQMLGEDLINQAKGRSGVSAGQRLQQALQDKVDADDAVIDGLWNRSRESYQSALDKFKTNTMQAYKDITSKAQQIGTNVMDTGMGIKKNIGMTLEQIQKLVQGRISQEPGFLIDFSGPYQNFVKEAIKAGGEIGTGADTTIINNINRALQTSRLDEETAPILKMAGLDNFDPSKVTGTDLLTLRKQLGDSIGKAKMAGDNNLARLLTGFKTQTEEILASGKIPGSNFARGAIKKQTQSYQELPEAVRYKTLAKPVKGFVQDIDPEKAFDSILSFSSNDRQAIGKIVQRVPEVADELAKDIQAKAVLKGAPQTSKKIIGEAGSIAEAQFTSKDALRKAIDEGYIPNTGAVKAIKESGEEVVDTPSKSAYNFFTQNNTGSALGDIVGKQRIDQITKPINKLQKLETLYQAPKVSASKTSQQVISGTGKQLLSSQGPIGTAIGNITESAYRPISRALASGTDAVANFIQPTTQFTQALAPAARGAAGAAISDQLENPEKVKRENLLSLLGVYD